MPVGIGLLVGIELTQGVFLVWLSPSVEDVVSNSLGAAIGFSLWLAARWLWGCPPTGAGWPDPADQLRMKTCTMKTLP